jgi:hypothetical protein
MHLTTFCAAPRPVTCTRSSRTPDADRPADPFLRVDDEFAAALDHALVGRDRDMPCVDHAFDVARTDLFVADRDDAVSSGCARGCRRPGDNVLISQPAMSSASGSRGTMHGRLDVHDDAPLELAAIRADTITLSRSSAEISLTIATTSTS